MSLDDVKRRILTRVSLTDLVGESVTLVTKSGRPMGCCPFHNEKTPSFAIYDDHYHCFGCKENGDAIDYIRKTRGMGFFEALRFLAEKYSVEVPELDEARGRQSQRGHDASLFKMMLEAQDFYQSNLQSPLGEEAKRYLLGRGFTEESIKAFGFGVTPREGWGLSRHLRSRGFRDEDMIDCSLATASTRDGRPFDFLRGRVTLPIHDGQGRVIGFGGRTLDGSHPKYLNSRESKLFDKSRTLYGFDKARRVMRERGRAVVVEGYMDTLQLWQAGFPETVACLGTAFTEMQLKMLRHATGMVVLLFDGDGAGQKATLAAVSIALAVPEVQVRAAALPNGEDPDTFVQKNGAKALEDLLAKSADLLDFAVRERLKTTSALAIPELVSREFIPWLARIPDQVQKSFLVSRIAQLTGIPGASLIAELASSAAPTAIAARARRAEVEERTKVGGAKAQPIAPLERLAFDFFGHIFHAAPSEIDVAAMRQASRDELALDPAYVGLLEEFFACLAAGETPAARAVGTWTAAVDQDLAGQIERLQASAPAFACADRAGKLKQVLMHSRSAKVKQAISRLKAEMTRAAADGNRRDEVNQLLKTIGELTRSLN